MELTKILRQIEDWAGEVVIENDPVGGGCIARTQRIKLQSGKEYFLKTGQGIIGGMFFKEASGLQEIRKANAIRVPEILLSKGNFLLMEYVRPYRGNEPANFFQNFGRQFAQMHRCHRSTFGFDEDNFIGATDQLNISHPPESESWTQFYFNNRIRFQYRLAERNGYATPELTQAIVQLESRIESILEGSEETPSLLHGDLWSGNFLIDEQGQPVLIDPAVYYGHREADLAMTKLFGGFSKSFYAAYQEAFPLPEGHEYRENLYKLYHILNHLNLFGEGYYSQAISLLRSYT